MSTKSENKTKPTELSVDSFIDALDSPQKQQDCRTLIELLQRISGDQPKMWGSSIVGFGEYHYKYATGREGDWALLGFSPRKANMTLYVVEGFENHKDLLDKLGTYTTSVSCLYVKKLSDIDLNILEQIVRQSYSKMTSGTLPHVTSVTTKNKEA